MAGIGLDDLEKMQKLNHLLDLGWQILSYNAYVTKPPLVGWKTIVRKGQGRRSFIFRINLPVCLHESSIRKEQILQSGLKLLLEADPDK